MIIKISTYGEFLTSRPAGRDSALACMAYQDGIKTVDSVELDFDGVIVMTPSWLSEFIQTLKAGGLKEVTFKYSSNPTVKSSIEVIASEI